MTTSFEKKLAFGRVAEQHIARWLRFRCDCMVLPVYELELDSGKGPQLFTPDDELVATDLLSIGPKGVKWIEAKHKSVFTWYNAGQRWETGIDLRHYRDYLRIADITDWPVWLLFLHEETIPAAKDLERWPDCPSVCPNGLFGGDLARLRTREAHRSDKHGPTGMVYWAHATLDRIATYEQVLQASKHNGRK